MFCAQLRVLDLDECMDRTDFTTSVDVLAALVHLGLQSMSGDEVAHRLREVDASLAIVLITGWKLEVDTSRLAAFDFYLHKPFGPLKGYRQWSSGL